MGLSIRRNNIPAYTEDASRPVGRIGNPTARENRSREYLGIGIFPFPTLPIMDKTGLDGIEQYVPENLFEFFRAPDHVVIALFLPELSSAVQDLVRLTRGIPLQ